VGSEKSSGVQTGEVRPSLTGQEPGPAGRRRLDAGHRGPCLQGVSSAENHTVGKHSTELVLK